MSTTPRKRGNPAGSKRVVEPKSFISTQRYTEAQHRLIASVAGEEVGAFIHDAAVDRAQQFADAGQAVPPAPPAPPTKRIIKEGVTCG